MLPASVRCAMRVFASIVAMGRKTESLSMSANAVVCQKSADPKRQQFPNMLEAGKIVALGPACGALAGIRARWQKFPCSRTQGKRRLEPREPAEFETLASPEARIWKISLYFP